MYFYSPLDGMPVNHSATPSIKFAGNHLYIWMAMERGREKDWGTVRVKWLAQEHNTMSSARARTQTTWSRGEHTTHKATGPPLNYHMAFVILFLDHPPIAK